MDAKTKPVDVERRLGYGRSAHFPIVGSLSGAGETPHYDQSVSDDPHATAGMRVASRHHDRAARQPPWVDVLLSLTQADLRMRYGRGRLRALRWLVEPFALAGVYLIFVAVVLNRPGTAVGLSLACAVVPFQLLMTTATNALGSITTRRSIILNMTFNRLLIPIATTLTEIVVFAASFSLIVVMMAIYGVGPKTSLVWLPVALLVNVLLALGLAFPFALFGLWFRELRIFAISFMRTLFFLAPSLVPHSVTSGHAYDLLKLNPLTGLFDTYRDVFLYGRTPAAWAVLYPAAIALLLLGLSVPLYRREQGQFAKVVE
jgi:ABC-type polysaccharide/polyol phosphate export permease